MWRCCAQKTVDVGSINNSVFSHQKEYTVFTVVSCDDLDNDDDDEHIKQFVCMDVNQDVQLYSI